MSDIVSDIKERIKTIKSNNQKTKELRNNEQNSLDNTLNMLNNFKKKESDFNDYNLTSNTNNSNYEKYDRCITNDNNINNINNISSLNSKNNVNSINEFRKSKNINSDYQYEERERERDLDRERDHKTINTDKNHDEAKNEYMNMINKRHNNDSKEKIFKHKNANFDFNEKTVSNNNKGKIDLMYDEYEKNKSDLRVRDKSKNFEKFDKFKYSEYQKNDIREELCSTTDRKKNQMSFLTKADEKNCNFETRKNQKKAQLFEILTEKELNSNNYNSTNNRNMNYDDCKFI